MLGIIIEKQIVNGPSYHLVWSRFWDGNQVLQFNSMEQNVLRSLLVLLSLFNQNIS